MAMQNGRKRRSERGGYQVELGDGARRLVVLSARENGNDDLIGYQ